MRHHFKNAAHGVAGAIGAVHHFLHLLFGLGIDTVQEDFVSLAERNQFLPAGRPRHADFADTDDVAEHANAEFGQQSFRESAHRDACGSFARAGAFQNVAGFFEIVLDAPARSACPGRGRVTGLRLSSAPSMSSTGSTSVQFFQSLF